MGTAYRTGATTQEHYVPAVLHLTGTPVDMDPQGRPRRHRALEARSRKQDMFGVAHGNTRGYPHIRVHWPPPPYYGWFVDQPVCENRGAKVTTLCRYLFGRRGSTVAVADRVCFGEPCQLVNRGWCNPGLLVGWMTNVDWLAVTGVWPGIFVQGKQKGCFSRPLGSGHPLWPS